MRSENRHAISVFILILTCFTSSFAARAGNSACQCDVSARALELATQAMPTQRPRGETASHRAPAAAKPDASKFLGQATQECLALARSPACKKPDAATNAANDFVMPGGYSMPFGGGGGGGFPAGMFSMGSASHQFLFGDRFMMINTGRRNDVGNYGPPPSSTGSAPPAPPASPSGGGAPTPVPSSGLLPPTASNMPEFVGNQVAERPSVVTNPYLGFVGNEVERPPIPAPTGMLELMAGEEASVLGTAPSQQNVGNGRAASATYGAASNSGKFAMLSSDVASARGTRGFEETAPESALRKIKTSEGYEEARGFARTSAAPTPSFPEARSYPRVRAKNQPKARALKPSIPKRVVASVAPVQHAEPKTAVVTPAAPEKPKAGWKDLVPGFVKELAFLRAFFKDKPQALAARAVAAEKAQVAGMHTNLFDNINRAYSVAGDTLRR